ncbi:MAG: redoxin domain-containing protein [Euryarchaeota archaeon]|nr:redoxin domain-containing protein [Euryarchaeota archaeon]
MPLELNQKAIDFTLPDSNKTAHTLSSNFGKNPVVIAIFPLAFSGTCTKEMCAISDRWADFKGVNAVVYGMSQDSLHALKGFAEKNNLKHTLLSDYNREVAHKYAGIYENLVGGHQGVVKRSVFVIDKTGTIRFKWVTEDPGVEPNYDEVKDVVKKL